MEKQHNPPDLCTAASLRESWVPRRIPVFLFFLASLAWQTHDFLHCTGGADHEQTCVVCMFRVAPTLPSPDPAQGLVFRHDPVVSIISVDSDVKPMPNIVLGSVSPRSPPSQTS
jgi:hypothetical protein